MKTCGEWRYSSAILDLGTVEVSGQLHTLAALHLGRQPLVPIGSEAEWAPELVWML
jgi:hypothetical protein